MSLWAKPFTTSELDAHQADSGAGQIGLRFTAIGDEWLEATMPLDHRTLDQWGTAADGALSILAESVASTAATMSVDTRQHHCLGQSLTVHHVARTKDGPVVARTLRLANNERSQVWHVEIRDVSGQLVTVAEMTMAVVRGKPHRAPTSPLT